MKNLKYILLLLFFIIYPTTTKAAICSDSEIVELQNVAKNISTSYDYVEENGNVHFNVTFTNMNPSVYLVDSSSKQRYYYSNNEFTIGGLQQGSSYKFNVYANKDYCVDYLVYTIYVNLPYYNPYYNDSLCSGIESYKFCKKFVNIQLDYDTFQKSVLAYKESLNKKDNSNEDISKNKWLNSLLELYINTYYIILPFIIIVCLVIRHQYNKKNDLF